MNPLVALSDIIREVRENTEAREELRRLILTDDLLAMPQQLAELIAVSKRHEQILNQHTQILGQHTQAIQTLEGDTSKLKRDTEYLKSIALEASAQGTIVAFLSSRLGLHRGMVVRGPTLSYPNHEFDDEIYEAGQLGRLTSRQQRRIHDTDIIVRARRRSTGGTVYIPVEISYVLDISDTERVSQSADLLRVVFPSDEVMPMVYGANITQGAAADAERKGITVFQRDQ